MPASTVLSSRNSAEIKLISAGTVLKLTSLHAAAIRANGSNCQVQAGSATGAPKLTPLPASTVSSSRKSVEFQIPEGIVSKYKSLYAAAIMANGSNGQVQAGTAAADSKLTHLPPSVSKLTHLPPSVSKLTSSPAAAVSSSRESAQVQEPSSATSAVSKSTSLDASEFTMKRNKAQVQIASTVADTKLEPWPASAVTNSGNNVNVPTLLPLPASALPSRSSTNENRILMQQVVSEHISSYYVQNLSSRSQDCLDAEYEFLRGQLTSNRNACLPYKPDVVNIWFREFVTRVPTAELEGTPLIADVNMINLVKTNNLSMILTAVATFRSISYKDGEELHFHATDSQSAKYILENGIDLTKCKGRRDFSYRNGFYVSTDYTKAIEWAIRKGRKCCPSTGAIITFKVGRELQNEKPHLLLETSTAEGRRNWEEIVTCFRKRGKSQKVHNMKFIRGPVGRNAFLRPGVIPVPYDFTQICICDKEYAKRYGSLSNICFVIFFKVN